MWLNIHFVCTFSPEISNSLLCLNALNTQYLLALNIKSLHSWLFLCASPWILFTSLIPHPHLPPNQTLSNGASFFSNAACRNMFLTEGEQEPSVSIFPLHTNNGIKAKLRCFVVPTHLAQLQPQQGGIPHPLMLTPPFEQYKTVKKFSALQRTDAWGLF